MLYESYSDQEEIDRVAEVLERGTWWLSGEEVKEFENGIADICDREHAVSFNSGTTALYTALVVNDISGEVIVPSFTYPATVNAVVASGCEPVFADIDIMSMGLKVESVARNVTEDTEAIVPVHFAGAVCKDIYEIVDVAHDEDVMIIEDNAQSLGAEYGGNKAGSFGDAAMLSFSFNKVVTTGAGGMLVTDSEYMANEFKKYRSQGKNKDGEFESVGLNFNMSSITAAIGVAQLHKIGKLIHARKRLASYFDHSIGRLDCFIKPVPRMEEQDQVHQRYNILCEDRERRDMLAELCDERDIPTTVSYEPCHKLDHFKQYRSKDMTNTNEISSRILTLPFHCNITMSDIGKIDKALIDFCDCQGGKKQ